MTRQSATRIRGITALAAAITTVISGCYVGTGGLDRQIEWVELNPKQPKAVRKAVLGKRLINGMGTEAIIASWGKPHSKLALGSGDARWTYRRAQAISGRRMMIEYTLVLRRGILIAVHQQTLR